MVRTPSIRWLLLMAVVGCGAATELDDEPPSQGGSFIGNQAGQANGSNSNGNGNGNGSGNSTGGYSPGNGSSSNGSPGTGSTSTGNRPGYGGAPAAAGMPATGGYFQGPSAGAPNTGGSFNTAGSGSFTPPDQCKLPFDPGPCRGSTTVFAHVNGSCTSKTYGGCEGNENRFASLEQCMAICEGRPFPLGCPAGRTQITSCLGCNPNGGCDAFIDICAASCQDSTDCGVGSPGCDNGVCQGIVCQ